MAVTFHLRHSQPRCIVRQCRDTSRATFLLQRCWQDLDYDLSSDSKDLLGNRRTISSQPVRWDYYLFHLFGSSYFDLALTELASDQKLFYSPLRYRLFYSLNCTPFSPPL